MNAIPIPTRGGWYRRRRDGAVRWVEALARCVHTGRLLVIYSRQGAQWGEVEVEPLVDFTGYEPDSDWPRWEPAAPLPQGRLLPVPGRGDGSEG